MIKGRLSREPDSVTQEETKNVEQQVNTGTDPHIIPSRAAPTLTLYRCDIESNICALGL